MNSFTLQLHSATRHEAIAGVTSFVATDASGSFGIQPGRARCLSVLEYGLARFRVGDAPWQYLACPGAVLRFADAQLVISTRRYLYDTDHARVATLLGGQLAQEEIALRAVKDNLAQLEQDLYRRLRQMERGAR